MCNGQRLGSSSLQKGFASRTRTSCSVSTRFYVRRYRPWPLQNGVAASDKNSRAKKRDFGKNKTKNAPGLDLPLRSGGSGGRGGAVGGRKRRLARGVGLQESVSLGFSGERNVLVKQKMSLVRTAAAVVVAAEGAGEGSGERR